MSNVVQWLIVIAVIVISAMFLVKKLRRSASGHCDGCCGNCKLDPDAIADCAKPEKDI